MPEGGNHRDSVAIFPRRTPRFLVGHTSGRDSVHLFRGPFASLLYRVVLFCFSTILCVARLHCFLFCFYASFLRFFSCFLFVIGFSVKQKQRRKRGSNETRHKHKAACKEAQERVASSITFACPQPRREICTLYVQRTAIKPLSDTPFARLDPEVCNATAASCANLFTIPPLPNLSNPAQDMRASHSKTGATRASCLEPFHNASGYSAAPVQSWQMRQTHGRMAKAYKTAGCPAVNSYQYVFPASSASRSGRDPR